jgi:4-hydroxy-2-oxoheptanedioate aldolase
MLRKNHLRELLNNGKPSLGTRLYFSHPSMIELVGYSGAFDYVEILAEYAPYDLHQLEEQGRAINLFENMTGFIKIAQEMRAHLAPRAMSAGIQNLLVADIRTAQDALECVRNVRAETPELGGLHGVGMGRDVGFVLEAGAPFYVQTTKDAVVALMIEKKEAIENLEAILSVKGVDMVQFGPADYSMSIGTPGNRANPAVGEAERYMIETALRMGVHPRVELREAKDYERYLDMGVKHFNVGMDTRTMFNWFKDSGERMRKALVQQYGN